MKKGNKINRREFVAKMARGAAAAGISLSATSAFPAEPSAATQKAIHYRKLGRTGFAVSVVSFGAMTTSDPAVIRRGVDLGINYIDTARAYMRGENEKLVAQAVKGIPRDKLYIATKIPSRRRRDVIPKSEMLKLAEESLAALNTDYVDVLLLHNQTQAEEVTNAEAIEVLTQLKKEGKVRFTGVSTHANVAVVADAAVKTGFFDVILAKMNFKSDKADLDALERAEKAGLGIVAMKTQAGGYKTEEMGGFTPHQAALKWVLQHKFVANTIPGMTTIQQVEENFTVAKSPELSLRDKAALKSYGNSIDRLYCRLCGRCEGDCPNGVPVAEVNRCVMYGEAYGDEGLARRELAALGPLPCADCSRCVVECRNRVDVKAKIQKALAILA